MKLDGRGFENGRGATILGALGVVAVVLAAVFDRSPVLVAMFLGILSLGVPEVQQWLAGVTEVSFGGIKLTRQTADAAAVVTQQLPVTDEQSDEGEEVKLIGPDWAMDIDASLRELRVALAERLQWAYAEAMAVPLPTAMPHAIAGLLASGLISPAEARIAEATLTVKSHSLKQAWNKDPQLTTRFMRAADRVAYTLRYIVLDRKVRQQFLDEGFTLLDYKQPSGRWPDFYAFRQQEESPVIRISVRMARTPRSTLLEETRGRLRRKFWETPLDDRAQCLIVVPKTSESRLDEPHPKRGSRAASEIRAEIPAVKRSGLASLIGLLDQDRDLLSAVHGHHDCLMRQPKSSNP